MRLSPAFACAFALCLALTAHASTLEQRGSPEPAPATMATYGFDVSPRLGLKSVVPSGWRLFIHQSAALPSSMNWRLGDPWTGVLASFAASSGLNVLVDWEQRQVLIRPADVAASERDTRSQIHHAATTPLPRFAPEAVSPAVPAGTVAALAPAASVREAREVVPVIRVNPTPSMVSEARARELNSPPKLMSNSDFSYQAAVAVNKPSARHMAQAIANRFNVRLYWDAPEYQLMGPLTLLSNSAEQDVELLQKALGWYSPVVVSYDSQRHFIRAVSRAHAPDLAMRELSQPHGGTAATKQKLGVTVKYQESVEEVLARFLRDQGYTMEWKVPGSFHANKDLSYEAETVQALLGKMLPAMGLTADLFSRERHVVVRVASAAHGIQ